MEQCLFKIGYEEKASGEDDVKGDEEKILIISDIPMELLVSDLRYMFIFCFPRPGCGLESASTQKAGGDYR